MSVNASDRRNWNRHQVHEQAEIAIANALVDQGFTVRDAANGNLEVREGAGRRHDVQVMGARTLHYMYIPKRRLRPRDDLLLGIVLFLEAAEPETFLIPSLRLVKPLNLTQRTLPLLRRVFPLHDVIRRGL